MATEEEKAELKSKVSKLVDQKYGGDWDRAFRHYAAKGGSGSLVEKDDLLVLLEDADIGNWMTRGAWADGIIEELDSSGDGKISKPEFQKVLKS